MELRRNIIKNSIFSVLEFSWPILTSLLATPYIVHKLGTDAYGILAIVSVTLGFFGVLDLGLTGAAIKYVAEYYEKKDIKSINKILGSTIMAYFVIGAVVASVIILSTNFLVSLLKIPASFIEVTKFAFYLAAFGFMLNLILGIFASIPKAIQRYDISTKISIFIGTLSVLVTVGLLHFGYWLRELVISGFVISIVCVVIYYLIDKKLLPELKIEFSFDFKLFKKLLSFGSFFLLSSLSAVILFHLDKFIIGSILGISVVSFYVIPGGIAQKIQGFVNSAATIAFPVSSSMTVEEDKEKLHKLYSEGNRIILILATMLSVPLIIFADKFLFFWIGEEFALRSGTVMMILSATYFFLCIAAVPWAIALGSGRSKINAFFAFFTAFLNILFLIFMIKPWGIVGAAWAYFLSAIISTPMMIGYIERKVLKLSGFRFWAIFTKISIVAVLQAILSIFILRAFAVNIWFTLAMMAISSLSLLLFYVMFGFAEEGDKKIFNIFLEKFKTKNAE